MKDNNLQLIWKTGVNEETKTYSDSELNEMVIKCARKSMRKIYPGWILRTIAILIVMMLLWEIITGYENIPITILRLVVLLIITVSMGTSEWSARKMDRYNFDMPVKEWLKYRIGKVEESIRFTQKYDIIVHVGTFIISFGIFLMHNYLMNVPFNLLIFAAVFLWTLIYILGCRMMVKKHHQKVLRHLQELYNKLEE